MFGASFSETTRDLCSCESRCCGTCCSFAAPSSRKPCRKCQHGRCKGSGLGYCHLRSSSSGAQAPSHAERSPAWVPPPRILDYRRQPVPHKAELYLEPTGLLLCTSGAAHRHGHRCGSWLEVFWPSVATHPLSPLSSGARRRCANVSSGATRSLLVTDRAGSSSGRLHFAKQAGFLRRCRDRRRPLLAAPICLYNPAG